jgi:hypothetical protein
MVCALPPLLASTSNTSNTSDTTFFVIFGVFVLAMVVLAFLTLRWAIRHDRAGFTTWRQRQQAASGPADTPTPSDTPTPDATPTPTSDPGIGGGSPTPSS